MTLGKGHKKAPCCRVAFVRLRGSEARVQKTAQKREKVKRKAVALPANDEEHPDAGNATKESKS